jgi:enoyl-CoA hydratase/carnithine racemase
VGRDLDPSVRAVVLLAEGPSFSAGLDRAMFSLDGIPGEPSLPTIAAMPPHELDALIAGYQEAFTWWRECDAVTVAGVQGHAVGAGFQLALACDLIVVDPTASFAMKEPRSGSCPTSAAPRRWWRRWATRGRWRSARRAAGSTPRRRSPGLAVGAAQAGHLREAIDTLLGPILAAPAGRVGHASTCCEAPGRSPHEQRRRAAAQAGRLASCWA